jgi:hypothetical protein
VAGSRKNDRATIGDAALGSAVVGAGFSSPAAADESGFGVAPGSGVAFDAAAEVEAAGSGGAGVPAAGASGVASGVGSGLAEGAAVGAGVGTGFPEAPGFGVGPGVALVPGVGVGSSSAAVLARIRPSTQAENTDAWSSVIARARSSSARQT